MKKLFFLTLLGLFISSCTTRQTKEYSKSDILVYELDKKLHSYKVDTPIHGKTYFITKGWAPVFLPNGERLWETFGGAIEGKKVGNIIFFTTEIRTSKKWRDEGGEESFLIKTYYPADAMVTDPRLTQHWMREVKKVLLSGKRVNSLRTWLRRAMIITEEDSEPLQHLLVKTEEKMKKILGTNKHKIFQYTVEVVPYREIAKIHDPNAWGRGDMYQGKFPDE